MGLILTNYALALSDARAAGAALRSPQGRDELPRFDHVAVAAALTSAIPSLVEETYEPWEQHDPTEIHLEWAGGPFVSVYLRASHVLIHHV
ncbi:MAG: hypothetical protein KDK70_41340, partial [Myxococcales bacterium]|nr:hypothetical protein [Myxococcales bacterium]